MLKPSATKEETDGKPWPLGLRITLQDILDRLTALEKEKRPDATTRSPSDGHKRQDG